LRPVLLDTGVIVAWLDRSEQFHERASESIAQLKMPLITCEAVIAETCYLLRQLRGAAEIVLENVAAGIFQIPLQLSASASEVRRLLHKYRDQNIDLADACLIQLANEFGTGEILTLDSDFEVYRWGRDNPFRLLLTGE
jgi:uncharacterized protein